MYSSSAGRLAILWALGASAAFASELQVDAGRGFTRPLLKSTYHRQQSIELPCPSCGVLLPSNVRKAYDDETWSESWNSRLVLDFSISGDGQQLQLDGESIFPAETYRPASHGGLPIYLTHRRDSTNSHITASISDQIPLELTSFALVVTESSFTGNDVEDDADDRVLQLNFMMTSLEGQRVSAEIAITMLRTGDGELLLLNVDSVFNSIVIEAAGPAFRTADAREERVVRYMPVPAALYRFREVVISRLDAFRHSRFSLLPPCHRRPHAQSHGLDRMKATRPLPSYRGRPPPLRPYSSHHHDRHHRHFVSHTLIRAAIAVLLPVMAGISSGLLVSLAGLLVGRMIGYVWVSIFPGTQQQRERRRRRKGRRGSLRKDKMFLLEEEDLERDESPPVYEHAPAYEDLRFDVS